MHATCLPRLNAPTLYPRVMRSPPMACTYFHRVGKKMPRAVSPRNTTHITITSDALSSSVGLTYSICTDQFLRNVVSVKLLLDSGGGGGLLMFCMPQLGPLTTSVRGGGGAYSNVLHGRGGYSVDILRYAEPPSQTSLQNRHGTPEVVSNSNSSRVLVDTAGVKATVSHWTRALDATLFLCSPIEN